MSNISASIGLAILSGAMCAVPFLAHDLFFFAWVSLVPLMFAIDGRSLTCSVCLGFVAGIVNFCISTYWMASFIELSKGYQPPQALGLAAVYWFYCAGLFGAMCGLFTWLKRLSAIHTVLLFPLVLVSVFSFYPMLFPYRFGDSQIVFAPVIQGIEFTGVYGIDFVVALANTLIYQALRHFQLGSTVEGVIPSVIGVCLICGWLSYGYYQQQWWEQQVSQWPRTTFGIVQPNEAPSFDHEIIRDGYMRGAPLEMKMSTELANAGAEIIVWPEARYKGWLDNPYVQSGYAQQLDKLNASLLFQDIKEVNVSAEEGEATIFKFNTAVWLDHSGANVQPQIYQKIKLIPFGEYVPIVSNNRTLKAWFESFVGDFLNEMNAGNRLEVFQYPDFDIVPLICYETVFPEFVAGAVEHQNSNSDKSALLIAVSNNGWFGSSHQPYQHILPSLLRAVETRTTLVHVVNNGPSIVASPAGTILLQTDFQQAGAYLAEVPINEKQRPESTFFTRYPNGFLYAVYLALFVVIVVGFTRQKTELE